MVQLALLPALPAAVAGGAQDGEWALWLRRPLLLPVPENAALLQRLPVHGHGGLPSGTSGPAPSSAPCGQSALLWPGASQWSGKALRYCLSTLCQFNDGRLAFFLKFILPATFIAITYDFSI